MPTQCALFLTGARIPHLERPVPRGRHDKASRRTERTPPHITRMPAQRADQCWVWQVWQQVPAGQVWSRNVLLECLAKARELFQISESTIDDRSKVVICSTAIEQMAHVGEVAREQAQWYIIGHLLLSKRQVSLSNVRIVLDECFVGQVAQILHGGN